MKTITVKANHEFDALLTRLAQRLNTTRSAVIRDAVRSYQQQLEREALRRQLREVSFKTRAQALQAADDCNAADADGL